MITRLYIDNFRTFSNFEFKPSRVNLLLGNNGSGKSNLFVALGRIGSMLVDPSAISEYFTPSDLTAWDNRPDQRFEVEIDLDGVPYSYSLTVHHDLDHRVTRVSQETVVSGSHTLFAFNGNAVHLHNNEGRQGTVFPWNGALSFLSLLERRPDNSKLFAALDWVRGSAQLGLVTSTVSTVSDAEVLRLARDGSNFASWYRHILQESPAGLDSSRDDLKAILPGSPELVLRSAGHQSRSRDLMVRYVSSGSTYFIEFSSLSDGEKALFILYTCLAALSPTSMIMLDEPEAHIGLIEVRRWLTRLVDHVGDQGQCFVISHHPQVLNDLASHSPFLFKRVSGGPTQVMAAPFEMSRGQTAAEQVSDGLMEDE